MLDVKPFFRHIIRTELVLKIVWWLFVAITAAGVWGSLGPALSFAFFLWVLIAYKHGYNTGKFQATMAYHEILMENLEKELATRETPKT
jgi:hypothetical protein